LGVQVAQRQRRHAHSGGASTFPVPGATLVRPPRIATNRLGASLWDVTLEGEHDVASVLWLRAELKAICDTAACVVVDLTEATCVDSRILGELVARQFAAESAGREGLVVVVAPGSSPDRLLRRIAPLHLIPTFDSRTDAIRWCRAGALAPPATPVAPPSLAT
jgi:anti-anti-sigma regulatory factor